MLSLSLSLSLLFSVSSSDQLNIQTMEFKEQNQANPVQNLLSSSHLSNIQSMELLSNNCLNPSQNREWSSSFSSRSSFLSQSHFQVPVHLSSPPSTVVSPLDEARETRVSIVNEKRLKRVISNRESARRSRMRKKKLIEELQFQVNQVQTVNYQLSEKLIRLLESNHQILQENSQLKEKVSSLQMVLSDLLTPLRGIEGINGNMIHMSAEVSSLSIHQ